MSRIGTGEGSTRSGIGAAIALAWKAAPATSIGYLALTVATAALPVAAAWLTRLVLDGLITPGDDTSVIRAALALGGVGMAALVAVPVSRHTRSALERRVGLLATDDLYSAVNRFDGLSRFEDPVFLDRLRLAAQSGGTTPSLVLDAVFGVARGVLTIGGFAGALLALSPVITAAVFVAAVPILVGELWLARRQAAVLWQIGPTERLELVYSSLLSNVDAAKEVRLFALGPFLRSRMLAERRRANVARRREDRRELAVQAGLGLLTASVAAVGLVWAVLAAQRGELSVGDVSMALAGVAGVQAALGQTANELALAHGHLLMFAHYRAVVGAAPDLPRAPEPRASRPLRDGIELRDVWFRYSDEHPWALRGVDLHIPHGQALAIVGRNGAGKSTLVKLLCRFYDPTRGAVLWDGVDLCDLDPAELRARIGAVFQDFMQYEMTATENIGVGDIVALDDLGRVGAAARRAGAHDALVALPEGYDTLLTRMFAAAPDGGDDPTPGVVLSGGQWQRVALARTFMRDSHDLLILDEPSSGLDAEAEHEIHRRLHEERSGRTTLLISHRLNTVRDADAIAVLDCGRIVETGTHDDLLELGGTYSHLFTLQAQGYAASPLPA